MSPEIIVAIIAAIVALLSAAIAVYGQIRTARLEDVLTQQRESAQREAQERQRVNLTYLNPLRLYVEEVYTRLSQIHQCINQNDGTCAALLYVDDARMVSTRDAEWFTSEGCYLISTCYLTGCLFYHFKKLRADVAYLRLGAGDDTQLLNLIFKVQRAFLQDLGIFYVLQPGIGTDIYLAEKSRLMSYREFSQHLQDPAQRVWFDRLITFYLETGQGQKPHRVEQALSALHDLSVFLDHAVGGGASLQVREEAELY